MRRLVPRLVLALGLAASGMALAAAVTGPVQYRWHDAHGVLQFSDTLSADAIARGYDIVNAQGVVVQHVPSPAERRAEEVAARAQAKLDAVRARQQAVDAQLLNAYPTEADLRKALQAQVSNVSQSMRATEINLHSQESSLADMLQRAAEIEHEKKPVPPYLTHDIAQQRVVIERQRMALQSQQQRRAAAQAAIAPQLAHYRQIKQQAQEQADSQIP
jgi:hypothetical protein